MPTESRRNMLPAGFVEESPGFMIEYCEVRSEQLGEGIPMKVHHGPSHGPHPFSVASPRRRSTRSLGCTPLPSHDARRHCTASTARRPLHGVDGVMRRRGLMHASSLIHTFPPPRPPTRRPTGHPERLRRRRLARHRVLLRPHCLPWLHLRRCRLQRHVGKLGRLCRRRGQGGLRPGTRP